MTRKEGIFLKEGDSSPHPPLQANRPLVRGVHAPPPSLASSAAIRVFNASFSSRARRAMSLTASNSSRLTMSRSRRILSAWLRTTASTSRLTPCAAPAASFIRRPISSKNRLLVWVIRGLPARNCYLTMAILGAAFKTWAALSYCPFLAIVFSAQGKPTESESEATPMIDSQVEIQTKDGKTTTFITHPERGGPV